MYEYRKKIQIELNITSLTKIPKPKIIFFFHCGLEDLQSLLRVWTAL